MKFLRSKELATMLILLSANLSFSQSSWTLGNNTITASPLSTTRLGLGVSNPTAKLHINSTWASESPFRIQRNGSTKLLMTSSGGTSLGYYNPSPPVNGLYVHGDIEANQDLKIRAGRSLYFGGESANTGYLKIHCGENSSNMNSYINIKGSLYFRNTNSSLFQTEKVPLGILKDGTVTINVWESYDNTYANSQGYELMVNGGILCEEVKVTQDVPNSDHVFEKDYPLMSLSEVEKFVWENKHLPEIPSAKEFQENGYSVGEMDDLLLRKVEELTLHVIALQKQLDELKAND